MVPTTYMCRAIEHNSFCFAVLSKEDGNIIHRDLPETFPSNLYTGMTYIYASVICINEIIYYHAQQ